MSFHIENYLQPGAIYGHIALKQAYYDACHDLCGTVFRETLHAMYAAGEIEMPTVTDKNDEETDFFTAVIMAHHVTHPKFEIVPGELVWVGEAVYA